MMKRLLMLSLLLTLPLRGAAQASNPQETFPNAVQINNPSVWLNFNDATAAFKDSVSGLSFSQNSVHGVITSPTGALSQGYVVVQQNALPAMTVNSFSVQFFTVPTAGPYTFVVVSGTAPSFTIASSFTVTVAATTSVQTFSAPANFTAFTVTAGERFGFWASSTTTALAYSAAGSGFYYFGAASSLPSGAQTYANSASQNLSISVAGVVPSAAGTPLQPGFDNTNRSNYSGEFAYSQFNTAPNNSLGSFDWNVPQSIVYQLDNLNWNRTGSLILASKGDLGTCAGVKGCTNNNGWEQLFLTMSGYTSELCFEEGGKGSGPSTWGGAIGSQICTSVDLPNGYNYNIVYGQTAGTGLSGDLFLYVNGLQVGPGLSVPGASTSSSYQYGFGAYQVSVVSGGSGFTANTYFTSTGGGPNCDVAGYITETGGALTVGTAGVVYTTDSGCTSAPTITLTAPTGTGATFSYQANGASLVSASPLMVPGYVSNGATYGPSTNSAQAPMFVDEYAQFSNTLSASQIGNLFYATDWYQKMMPIPARPPNVILSEDGCQDYDNLLALYVLIRAHQLGTINLLGADVTDTSGISQAFYRQALDSAGLNQIPVSSGTASAQASNCSSSTVSAYNASTPQAVGSYESPSALYRTAFASHSGSPIFIANGGPLDGLAAFLGSGADSISPLTGTQLWQQNATNGGALSIQGPAGVGSFTNYYTYPASQTVLTNGMQPIYGWGLTPQGGGPGVLVTRTGNDPLWLAANHAGSDLRSCWDCMPAIHAVLGTADPFGGGVTITATGGSGLAASTAFTSTGGGANCVVSGFMMSTGGTAPYTFVGAAGQPNTSTYGLGSGCYSNSAPPTIVLTTPTGTPPTLTATTLASACQGVVQTTSSNGSIATSPCTNFYSEFPSTAAATGYTPLFQWFINSLVDPNAVGQPRQP